MAPRLCNRDECDLYGALTTGLHWRFLRLSGNDAFIDRVEYDLDEIRKIYGTLLHALQLDAAPASA